MQELASWCLNILHTYSTWQQVESTGAPCSSGVRGAATAATATAAAEAEAERADQLKALLKLLASLTQSFDTDMSSRVAEVRFHHTLFSAQGDNVSLVHLPPSQA